MSSLRSNVRFSSPGRQVSRPARTVQTRRAQNNAPGLMEQGLILINPFDKTVPPKLQDGKKTSSSGLRLRSTGELVLSTDRTTIVALIPFLGHSLIWSLDGTNAVRSKTYKGHMNTQADRDNVKQARLVSQGLKMTMINNADQNEGYWEAARLPVDISEFSLANDMTLDNPLEANFSQIIDPEIDLSNYSTYQSGKLRDLHRYQFKLNSTDTNHDFAEIHTVPTIKDVLDEQFDVVILKLHGRAQTGAPTSLLYETMSNQELIYAQETALSRLMTTNRKVPGFETIMLGQNHTLPGLKVN